MGGMAIYDMTIRYPDLFAVAVPICGTVNPDRITKNNGVKYWIFHGADRCSSIWLCEMLTEN